MSLTPELTFRACAGSVASFLAKAQKSLQIAVCWFTHPEIYNVLLNQTKAGLKVQLIVNYDQINFRQDGLNFSELEKLGAKIFGFPGPGLLHHKFAVADDKRLLTGSFNWTRSEHFDHVVVWDCPQTSLVFAQAFDDLIPECKVLNLLAAKPIRHVFFQQLHQPALWSVQDLRKAIIAGGKVWIAPFGKNEMAIWQQCYAGQRHYCMAHPAMEQYWNQYGLWQGDAFREWLPRQEDQAGLQATARYCLKMKPGDVLIAVAPKMQLLALGLVSSDPEAPFLPAYGVSRYVPWIKWPDGVIVPDPAILKPGRTLRRYSGSGLQVVEALTAITLRPNPAF